MNYGKDSKGVGVPPRKKLKTSDLPLASATRAAIEGLAHTFKKKGGYDSLRKQVWDDLEGSDFETEFTRSLLSVAEEELEKNPSQLLKLDRGKAALLIEGAVDRAGVYQTAEARIDSLIDAHIEEIETGIRALRKNDIGEEAAQAEQLKGGKTDEQYAEQAAKKRAAREKIREDVRENERLLTEERRKLEKLKRREEERKIEAEQEKKREEKEAKRKADLELQEKEDKRRRRDEDPRDSRDSRDSRHRDSSRERDRDRDGHRRRHDDDYRRRDDKEDRHRRSDDNYKRRPSTRDAGESSRDSGKAELSKEEIERLVEQEALNDLLKEGERSARRSRHQPELEVDSNLAPPPRKTMPVSAIVPLHRDSTVKSGIPMFKSEESGSKTPQATSTKHLDEKSEDRERKSSHRRDSRDRDSSRRSRSRRRRDSRDRGEKRSDSRDDRSKRGYDDRRDRDRDYRRRYDDRDDRRTRDSKDDRRRDERHDRRRDYRSRSDSRDRAKDRTTRAASPPPRDLSSLEAWKLAAAKKREEEARPRHQDVKKTAKLPVQFRPENEMGLMIEIRENLVREADHDPQGDEQAGLKEVRARSTSIAMYLVLAVATDMAVQAVVQTGDEKEAEIEIEIEAGVQGLMTNMTTPNRLK
ncbi:Histone-lysine N-methyltransferase [Chlorociboria aeruginascens]|nr:Histone-lysine N-methyltransferase [Chlorociboria aeruginascens]